MSEGKLVGMSLNITAEASVKQQVEEDLKQEDPSPDKAQAVLRGDNEDTEGNDGEGSNGDDK